MVFTKVISKLPRRQNFAAIRKNLDGTMTAFAECRHKLRGLNSRKLKVNQNIFGWEWSKMGMASLVMGL